MPNKVKNWIQLSHKLVFHLGNNKGLDLKGYRHKIVTMTLPDKVLNKPKSAKTRCEQNGGNQLSLQVTYIAKTN